MKVKKDIRWRFTAALLPLLFWNRIPGHTTREPPVGFKLVTKGIQCYVIANLDKTSLSCTFDSRKSVYKMEDSNVLTS